MFQEYTLSQYLPRSNETTQPERSPSGAYIPIGALSYRVLSGGHSTEGHSTERHSTEGHSTERHSTEGHSTERHSTEGHSTERHSTEGHSTERHLIPVADLQAQRAGHREVTEDPGFAPDDARYQSSANVEHAGVGQHD
jgi:hypothetical protein